MTSIKNIESTTYMRLAVLFIVSGLLLAVDSLLKLNIIYKLWPLLILILGTGFTGVYLKQKPRGVFCLVIGEYLLLFSLMALYFNFTTWRSISVLWPLFVAFLGLIFVSLYLFGKKNKLSLFVGLLFISLSFFFFIIFSTSGQYWWIVLILIGLSIFVSGKLK